MIGLHMTDDFWSDAAAATGVITAPPEGERTPHRHAMCVIGFAPGAYQRMRRHDAEVNATIDDYEVRNSVGADWGDAGHAWIPAPLLDNPRLAADAWTIRR